MKLTTKLLSYLNDVFHKEADSFLAIRVNYDGQMTWKVEDQVFSTEIAGGTGVSLTQDISAYTLQGFNDYITAQTGYSVVYFNSEYASLSSCVLMDSSGDENLSNGDHLYAYTSLLWVYFDAVSVKLKIAADDIVEMLKQMIIGTAEQNWLEEWGGYFSVPKLTAETDSDYQTRIPKDAFQIRSTNNALEEMIEGQIGISVDVIDIDWSGDLTFLNQLGIVTFAPGSFPTGGYPYWGDSANDNPLVCTFAVIIYVEDVSSLTENQKTSIRNVVEKYRAAGTLALYYGQTKMLHTNIEIETLNDIDYVTGPKTGAYTPIVI